MVNNSIDNSSQKKSEKKLENIHWADHSAQRTIDTFPNEEVYTMASGITPSGYIHIGNFREVITTEIVRKALENKGKKTKFIYSWDSYDAFRKVPQDVPQEWSKYLRMPVGQVPNPFDSEAQTYGEHFIKLFEEEVKLFNFPVEFQKQHEFQTSGMYADSIKKILNNKYIVIEELNKYRGDDQQLDNDWWPIDIYDNITQKDTTELISYDGEYTITYKCNENNIEKIVNFKEDPRVKLRWKADWPMRWNYFKVCFEPGGKDHSTPGSSYTVGQEMIRRIFGREPPVYTMYDFVLLKGQGGKISSSKGGALRVKDVLEVYTPELVLYLFTGSRPNSEINISFDIDVIKIYEDFDKLERLYFGLESEKNEKQRINKLRQYELSIPNRVEIPELIPFQPSFRHLTMVSQANDFDFSKVREYYSNQINSNYDEKRLEQRFNCAKNWIEQYAPEEFIFSIKKELGELTRDEEKVLNYLKEILPKAKESGKEYVSYFKEVEQHIGIEMKEFFRYSYLILVGQEKGPKISDFLFENKTKFTKLVSSPYTINNLKYDTIEEEIETSDFSKLGLQIGEIIRAERHPQTSKLLVLQIQLAQNDIRNVIFSVDNGYSTQELLGKKVVVLTNLKPSRFKGVNSEAMVIACETQENHCGVLHSELDIGQYLEFEDVENQSKEIADCEIFIEKEEFLQMNFKAHNGKLYFNDIEIKYVEIDKKLSGKIC